MVPRQVAGVLVEVAGDEWVAYAPSSNTAHALNRAAGELFEAIDGVRSVDDLAEHLDVSVEVVGLGLDDLAEAGLVELDDAVPLTSRRDMLKKLGVGSAAAAALPVVETIVMPSALAAQSVVPPTPAPTDFPTPSPSPGTPAPTPGTPAPTPGTPAPTPGTPAPTPAPTPGTPAPTPAPSDNGVVCTGATATHFGWNALGSPLFSTVVNGSGTGVATQAILVGSTQNNSFVFPGFGAPSPFFPLNASAAPSMQYASVGTTVAGTVRLQAGSPSFAFLTTCDVTYTITIPPPPQPV